MQIIEDAMTKTKWLVITVTGRRSVIMEDTAGLNLELRLGLSRTFPPEILIGSDTHSVALGCELQQVQRI